MKFTLELNKGVFILIVLIVFFGIATIFLSLMSIAQTSGVSHDWSEIINKPNIITSETDPTVAASVKDGVSWSEVSNRPSGLDDGDQVGITQETDPTVSSFAKRNLCFCYEANCESTGWEWRGSCKPINQWSDAVGCGGPYSHVYRIRIYEC